MRYLSHTQKDIADMLQAVGKDSLSALFESVPAPYRLKRPLAISAPQSELELKALLSKMAPQAPKASFLGAGATAHFVPEFASQQLLRGEWLTAYTPYQPEASQGTLQAIFEFQTMVASLLGTDVANASMYDGATAMAEAVLMASRLKPSKKQVLISRYVHPEYREACCTLTKATGLALVEYETAPSQLPDDVVALVYQTPNFLGALEPQAELIELAHRHDALAVAVNTEPVAFGVIRSPGTLGADIVVSEGIGLCGHLSLGAPGVGLFGCAQQYLRQMPGRLCGQTADAKGRRGFVLTLSTREQHIRREKATSNICTNHNLMALGFSMALSLYGKSGFEALAKRNLQKTLYFREQCHKKRIPIAVKGAHFNETVLQFASERELNQVMQSLAKEGIFAGVALSRWYKEREGQLLVATTELHTDADIDYLTSQLA